MFFTKKASRKKIRKKKKKNSTKEKKPKDLKGRHGAKRSPFQGWKRGSLEEKKF